MLALTQTWCNSLSRAKQAGLKKIKLSTSVHLAFSQLELGDLPLGLSIGPW